MKIDQGICIKSPAKINLGLEIIGRKEDGYHLIETVYQSINIYDELFLLPKTQGILLKTDSKDLDCGKENIVYRAASVLLDYIGYKKGVEIFLKKRIPIGAGLGGGSSDAAGTLKGIIKLYGITISENELYKIASSLGADVPFFLNGPTAFGFGTGTLIEGLPILPPFWVILVKPNFSISTAWAYREFNCRLTKRRNKIKILRLAIESADKKKICEALINDFESLCFTRYPILQGIKEQLFFSGACGALMSGSGSSIFGLYNNSRIAKRAYEKIKDSIGNENDIFLCHTIAKRTEE